MYKQFDISMAGDSLIMHNGRTANPLDEYAKAMKQISGKRKKTDADFAALADLEYRAGLYLNKAEEVIVPSRVLEAHIAEGARKSKEGKLALSGMFVDTDMVLTYAGGPLSVDELVESEDHRMVVPVRVSTSRVMRTRPHFQDWSGSFRVSLHEEVANGSQLEQWVTAAGALVGLCDWRPRHGRYEVTQFAEAQKPVRAVA